MSSSDLPQLALSVRQPYAWAIIHAGKPVENRGQIAIQKGNMKAGVRVAIHASKTLGRDEYEGARGFMRSLGVDCPPPDQLLRGGIIGSVFVDRIVTRSPSPWFFGPRALVLADPQPCDFIPCVGERGYFTWKAADPSIVPPPAKWMLSGSQVAIPARAQAHGAADPAQLDIADLLECDCQLPEPASGVAYVSNSCPVHNLHPDAPEE